MNEDYKLIALCTSRVYDTEIHSFIEVFNERVKNSGYRLLVFALNADMYWNEDALSAECAVFDYIPYQRVHSVILMDEKIKSHRVAEAIVKRARAAGKPVIVLDGAYEGCSDIRFDFAGGFESVVRHVLEEHDVKRPHFMAGIRGNVFSDERLRVFREQMEAHGYAFDESCYSYGEFWATPARAATRKLLEREELPDAIICANDIMAINVSDVLQGAGIKVPEQVIVTGFDGYDEVFMVSPAITTVDCDPMQMAEYCAQLYLERDITAMEPQEIRVKPKLIVNKSCGCPHFVNPKRRSTLSRFNNDFYRYQDDTRLMHDSITGMIMANTVGEAVACIHEKYTDTMCCVVDQNCFRTDLDFFSDMTRAEGYMLFYDPDSDNEHPVPFDIGELLPNAGKRLASGYPLLIQAVDYMNKPLGYVVYFIDSYDITEYGCTAGTTEMISMGFGGHITVRYQQYLRARVEEMYRIDALTGLYTRLAFREEFEKMKDAPERQGQPLLVVMADLDYLKKINDGIGHTAGDKAIAAVADSLRYACPEDALCVRFGGDEMMAFIPNCTDRDGIFEKIRERMEFYSERLGFTVSASCGGYETVLNRDTDLNLLIHEADEEMYLVKRARKEKR